MATNKILLVIANSGYQPVEYGVPKNLFEQAGFIVETASNYSGIATAKDQSTTLVDVTLENVSVADYDGILFIGGPGALDHLNNEESYKILTEAARLKKLFGAICISTRILAYAGVLKGKKATGWNEDNALDAIYQEYEVRYAPQDIVTDGNIITATGPTVAREFGESIISMLQSKNNWQ